MKIAPAPAHIAHRLELIDQRSISNVADATNYVLNEIGQPTHAFDLDKLEGGKIIVRRARAGETLITLDGGERKLSPEDLVIADAVKPVALAGVMGGEATMITYATKNVLIESAWFDPASIRRTSRRLGMHTDASHRYERGADCGITPVACASVAELIVASAGGAVSEEIDVVARAIPQPRIQLASSEVKRILGVEFPRRRSPASCIAWASLSKASEPRAARIHRHRAHLAARRGARNRSHRRDSAHLLLSQDSQHLAFFPGGVVELPNARKQAELRSRLLALGYNESLSSTFIPQEDARFFSPGAEPVRIANPLSEEASFMRTTLVPGLLRRSPTT